MIVFAFGNESLFPGAFLFLNMYFWLCWVLVAVQVSLDAVPGLLVVVAAFVVERGLQGVLASVFVAPRLLIVGLEFVMDRLGFSGALGMLPDQGSNPCPLPWQMGVLTTEPPGKPSWCFSVN